MRNTETYELSICTDCLMFHANGDLSGTPDENVEAVTAAAGVPEGFTVVPGDDDSHFSWSSCDTCHTHLGGDRHQAWLISTR